MPQYDFDPGREGVMLSLIRDKETVILPERLYPFEDDERFAGGQSKQTI